MIRTLSIPDVPQALELSLAAGWNQTMRDWQRVLLLEPEGCFCFEMDGRVVATTTAVCYEGRVAWIGMVLTHPDFRRMGLARQLMEHALRSLRSRGIIGAKLDATEQGRPLYAALGFADECVVERWRHPLTPSIPGSMPLLPRFPAFHMDSAAFGFSRGDLFGLLREEKWVSSPDLGFAFTRTGASANYFGPCLATSESNARRFVEWCLAVNPGLPLYWDLFPENAAAVGLAKEFGFLPVRRLVRMSLQLQAGRQWPLIDPYAYYALSGFEYG